MHQRSIIFVKEMLFMTYVLAAMGSVIYISALSNAGKNTKPA